MSAVVGRMRLPLLRLTAHRIGIGTRNCVGIGRCGYCLHIGMRTLRRQVYISTLTRTDLPYPVMTYRGRFAPSPTGPLHFGSLVSALASWLDARAHRGAWLVRVEDIDGPRTVPGAAEDILATLERFGMHADEKPVWQSQRMARYEQAFEQLKSTGSIYPCGCTRKEIADSLLHAHARNTTLAYPGTCRDGLHGKPARAWRLRVPDGDAAVITFEDRWQGAADAEPGHRGRRFRPEARGRPMGVSTGGGRRRCGRGHHAHRARRGSARFDGAADLSAALSRCADAPISACARRDERTRRKAEQADWRDRARRRHATRSAERRRAASWT